MCRLEGVKAECDSSPETPRKITSPEMTGPILWLEGGDPAAVKSQL
jgi:hypothetical protein